MRSIVKGQEPRELIQWKLENAQTPQNLSYGGGGFPAEEIRTALLSEQFHLCAYTMKRLLTVSACKSLNLDLRNSCHIEHVLPQCREVPGEDIDYLNMIACYPPSNSNVACGYGAKFKDKFDPTPKDDDDPADGLFVSPLSANAERHFDFDAKGHISGRSADGDRTIRVLKLDHPELINDRAAVIKGLLTPKGKPLSATAARRLAAHVMRPDAQRCLTPFCTAVASAALAFAVREERRSRRLQNRARAR